MSQAQEKISNVTAEPQEQTCLDYLTQKFNNLYNGQRNFSQYLIGLIDKDTLVSDKCEITMCNDTYDQCSQADFGQPIAPDIVQEQLVLVFSDEFKNSSRKFGLGQDKFMYCPDTMTEDPIQGYYCPSSKNCYIKDEKFVVESSQKNSTCQYQSYLTNQPFQNFQPTYGQVNKTISAALPSSWQQFCFRGGYIETYMSIENLTPNTVVLLNLQGNLARRGTNSAATFMPWSYNTCDNEIPPSQWPFSKCPDPPGQDRTAIYGFKKEMVRGSTRIKMFQANNSTGFTSQCQSQNNTFLSQGIQIAPSSGHSIPCSSNSHFNKTSFADSGISYPCIQYLGSYTQPSISEYTAQQTELINFQYKYNKNINNASFKIGVFWQPGFQVRYYVNDKLISQLDQNSVNDPVDKNIKQRYIPFEPSYLQISTLYGACANESPKELDEQRLMRVNFEYIRLYQNQNRINVGCDTTAYPSCKFIQANKNYFINSPEEAAHFLNCNKSPFFDQIQYQNSMRNMRNIRKVKIVTSTVICGTLILLLLILGLLMLIPKTRRQIITRSKNLWKYTMKALYGNKISKEEQDVYRQLQQQDIEENQAKLDKNTSRNFQSQSKVYNVSKDDRVIAWKQIKATNQGLVESLTLHKIIGSGSFGVVYAGNMSGLAVAVKLQRSYSKMINIDREAIFVQRLRHPNIVSLYEYLIRQVTCYEKGKTNESSRETSQQSMHQTSSLSQKLLQNNSSNLRGGGAQLMGSSDIRNQPIHEENHNDQELQTSQEELKNGNDPNVNGGASKVLKSTIQDFYKGPYQNLSTIQRQLSMPLAIEQYVSSADKNQLTQPTISTPSGGAPNVSTQRDVTNFHKSWESEHDSQGKLRRHNSADQILGSNTDKSQYDFIKSYKNILNSSKTNTSQNDRQRERGKNDSAFGRAMQEGAWGFNNSVNGYSNPTNGVEQGQERENTHGQQNLQGDKSQQKGTDKGGAQQTAIGTQLQMKQHPTPPVHQSPIHQPQHPNQIQIQTQVQNQHIQQQNRSLDHAAQQQIQQQQKYDPQNQQQQRQAPQSLFSQQQPQQQQPPQQIEQKQSELQQSTQQPDVQQQQLAKPQQQQQTDTVVNGNKPIQNEYKQPKQEPELQKEIQESTSNRNESQNKVPQGERISSIGLEFPLQKQVTDYSRKSWIEIWMVFEYCDRGSLRNYIKQLNHANKKITKEVAQRMILQVANGIHYLHCQNVVHGDLKSSNILLSSCDNTKDGELVPKISDFGLSRKLNDANTIVTSPFGTVTHIAPEFILKGKCSFKSDVYSFAILWWELMEQSLPYDGMNLAGIIRYVCKENKRPQFSPETKSLWPQKFLQLCEQCWSANPRNRPDFAYIVQFLESNRI